MRKYVFIGHAISNIGGAQIYFYNKVKYCEKNGWDVYVFSGIQGSIYIEKLKQYEKLINRRLLEYPYLYSKCKVRKIVKWLLECIDYNDGDEVLIECGGVPQALWGELLARACNGRNMVLFLGEKLKISDKSIYNFLEFKWRRKEFRCISAKIMQDIFADKNLLEEQCYEFRAPCANSMENIEIPIKLDIVPNKPVIGIIGRLDKNYIYVSLSEIKKFAQNHPDEFYNILIVGGGEKKHHKKIKKMISNVRNLKVIIAGRLYPVPQKLIEKINVAIGSSASIRLPWFLDIPSISVDLNSNKALGFLGYDTQNTQFPLANEKLKNISDCLENFFYNSYIENYEGEYVAIRQPSEKDTERMLDVHLEYVKHADSQKKYFEKFVSSEIKTHIIKIAYFVGGDGVIRALKRLKAFFYRG